ncbi:MAG TPA: hypothetical protein DCD96_02135 [Flavobacteriales bacterium]|nr:hypothetical protein [Flavobacteriales bacterium]
MNRTEEIQVSALLLFCDAVHSGGFPVQIIRLAKAVGDVILMGLIYASLHSEVKGHCEIKKVRRTLFRPFYLTVPGVGLTTSTSTVGQALLNDFSRAGLSD